MSPCRCPEHAIWTLHENKRDSLSLNFHYTYYRLVVRLISKSLLFLTHLFFSTFVKSCLNYKKKVLYNKAYFIIKI